MLLLQLLVCRSLGNLCSMHTHVLRMSHREQCKTQWFQLIGRQFLQRLAGTDRPTNRLNNATHVN